jgi:hypothetical protein
MGMGYGVEGSGNGKMLGWRGRVKRKEDSKG